MTDLDSLTGWTYQPGVYPVDDLTIPPGRVLAAVDGRVTLRVSGVLTLSDDVVIGPGFTFRTDDPADPGIRVRVAGKRTQLYGPRFIGFGNKVPGVIEDVAEAPYPLVYDSFDPETWSDWNHLYSPQFEFCYGGLLETSPSNVMVTNMIARGRIGPGGALRAHMSGSPSGASGSVSRIWTAHCEGPAIQLTKDPDVTRPGGWTISDWTNEPGSGQLGTGAYVESDGNKFLGDQSFIGGDVRYHWAEGVKGNIVKAAMTRTKQGGVGPAQDIGPVKDQFYDLTPFEG